MLQDLRFALRMMVKNPGFTAVAVMALGLGIGVNTTVFTLVNAVLLRGLPYPEAHSVMHLENNNLSQGRESIGVSYPDFEDWRAESNSFTDLAAFSGGTVNVSDGSAAPERYQGAYMSANSFGLIGQKTQVGRDFRAGEDQEGAEPVAIIGFSMWQDRYGREPDILGKVIRINSVPTVVVGVMPQGVRFPLNADLWVPLTKEEGWERRDYRGLEIFGRLAPGISQQQAQAEMDGIGQRLAESYPETNKGVGVVVKPYNDEFNGGPIRLMFMALMGAVGFVLLIACANVANLLLARAAVRVKEVAVRAALGASRWRVARQLLAESLLLAFMGGAAGLLLSIWGIRLFDQAVADVGKPYWIDFRIDLTVFTFLFLVCLATGVVFGLAPAWQAAKTDINTTLNEGGRGSRGGIRLQRLSAGLVIGELAIALVLLAGAGLMIRSFLNTYNLESGAGNESLLTMSLLLPESKYGEEEERILFHQELASRTKAIPGAISVAIASHLPFGGEFNWDYEVEDQPSEDPEQLPEAGALVVSPGYFPTMGVELIVGRTFRDDDGKPGREMAIVNQIFADKHWPGQDPLGRRIRLHDDPDSKVQVPWLTVIGVSPHIHQNGPSEEVQPLVYIPYRQRPSRFANIVAHTAVPPKTLTDHFRRVVQAVDEDLPVYSVATLDERLRAQTWPWRVFGTLFAVFALIALVLSSVGIYAVMAYSVNQRLPEMGVRMALGAKRGEVVRLVLKQGMLRLIVGLAIGLVGAFGLSRVLASFLVRVTPADPLTFIAISLLLTVSALAACLIPAARASRVDPSSALRVE